MNVRGYLTPKALSLVALVVGCENAQKSETQDVATVPSASVILVDLEPPTTPGGPLSSLIRNVQDPEERALIFLKPVPNVHSSDFDLKSQYVKHACKGHAEGLVCTACYVSPRGVREGSSVVCPLAAGAECTYISTLPAESLKAHYGIDLRYCEAG